MNELVFFGCSSVKFATTAIESKKWDGFYLKYFTNFLLNKNDDNEEKDDVTSDNLMIILSNRNPRNYHLSDKVEELLKFIESL